MFGTQIIDVNEILAKYKFVNLIHNCHTTLRNNAENDFLQFWHQFRSIRHVRTVRSIYHCLTTAIMIPYWPKLCLLRHFLCHSYSISWFRDGLDGHSNSRSAYNNWWTWNWMEFCRVQNAFA